MKKFLLLLLLALCLGMMSCGVHENDQPVEKAFEIVMPYDDNEYEGGHWDLSDDWTLAEVVSHFEDLGFTNIETIALYETKTTFEFDEIGQVKINDQRGGFSQGDTFMSDMKVEISYYRLENRITVDNNLEFANLLLGSSSNYIGFASEHDGEYVVFDAHVVYTIEHLGQKGYVFEVCAGDYTGEDEKGHIIRVDLDSLTNEDYINRNVELNENVLVMGKIDASYSNYFNKLYIDAVYVRPR